MEPTDRAERKRRGAWYTPADVVDFLVEQAVLPALAEAAEAAEAAAAGAAGVGRPGPVRVLDPACGDGRLLTAAAAAAVAPGSAADAVPLDLVGIELDAATAAAARRAVPGATILVGDGRTLDPGGPFDAIIGNPPYLGQLARATSRGGRSRLGGGPYADAAAEFLLRAVELARPDGGRVALVLPQSVLATRDTAAVRAVVRDRASVDGLWWAESRVFDAAVHVAVLVLGRGLPQGPIRRWQGREHVLLPDAPTTAVEGSTWAPLIADAAGIPAVALATGPGCVGDLATARAGFRQHFYGLVPFVSDDAPGPPLVTSGLIDPGRCSWGERPARFAKRRFEAPRVDLRALAAADPVLAAWAERELQPKVLVAVQTRVIEAAVDEHGAWLPSVPVISVHPRRADDLWPLAAVLLAPPVAAWAAARHVGSGLGPTSLRLRAADLLGLPLPPRPWARAADRLRVGDVDGCAVEMTVAYGLDRDEADAVLSWWRGPSTRLPVSRAVGARTPRTASC